MTKKVAHTLSIALFTTMISANSQAQPSDPIKHVASTLESIDLLIEESETAKLLDNTSISEQEQVDSTDIDLWASAQMNNFKAGSGLEFRAGYDHKFGTGSDDIYDDLYSYKHRFNVMLSWNILNSGVIGKRAEQKEVDLKSEQLLLNKTAALNNELIQKQSREQQQILEAYRNKVYATKVELYQSLLILYNTLLNQGQLTSLEKEELAMELEMAKGSISHTEIEVENLLDIKEYLSKQVDIDENMVNELVESSTEVESSKIDQKIISNEIEKINYWKGVTIAPYAKAQHYSNTYFTTSRITANLGISATLPLFTGTKSRRAEVQARENIAINTTDRVASSLAININDLALRLNRNLEQLDVAIRLERLSREKIKLAELAYKEQQLPMQQLAEYYINLLDIHTEIVAQIEERESLKTVLLLSTL